jgi:hypothetical protein
LEATIKERATEMGKGQGLPMAEGFKYFRLHE